MTTLRAQTSVRVQKPSAPASAAVEYRWERFSDIITEVVPLIRKHWQEVDWFEGQLPLDPDWKQGLALDRAGVLHILTARIDGLLIGYIYSYLLPSIFFSCPWATVQGFWLDPIRRSGWTGVKLFKENERGLQALGARAISAEVLLKIAPERGTVGRILTRLGYAPVGTLYAKVL